MACYLTRARRRHDSTRQEQIIYYRTRVNNDSGACNIIVEIILKIRAWSISRHYLPNGIAIAVSWNTFVTYQSPFSDTLPSAIAISWNTFVTDHMKSILPRKTGIHTCCILRGVPYR